VTGRGSIDPASAPLPGLDSKSLAAWAATPGVAAVVVIDRELIGKLSAEIEAGLRLEQDPVAQGLVALRAVRRHAGNGVWTEPQLLEFLPVPAFEPLQRTFDLLVPDRTALVAYVIEDDRSRVHASMIAVKVRGDIIHAATHRAIADLAPEAALARTWDEGAGAGAVAARARKHVGGEHPAQQLGPRDPAAPVGTARRRRAGGSAADTGTSGRLRRRQCSRSGSTRSTRATKQGSRHSRSTSHPSSRRTFQAPATSSASEKTRAVSTSSKRRRRHRRGSSRS
jgi:hypothetical protein